MEKTMTEPPKGADAANDLESVDPLHFVVGQDRRGNWVVTETHGLYGGIFCSRDAALRFAKFETADRLGECAVTGERLEFDVRRRG
jgi:hypothetical protein